MHFFNHYSTPIVAALLLAGGLSLVLRRGGRMRHWLILGGAMLALGTLWLVFRPVATPAGTPNPGQPLLLELQSPYCLACLALKPRVDQLETNLGSSLVVCRVDIQSEDGQRFAQEYGIEFTPTFILFDAAGKEQWRSVGKIDATSVRQSLMAQISGSR